MKKTVNVKGVANLPLYINNVLYERGAKIDIELDRDEWVGLGVAFLQKMINGYRVDFVEQKPAEEEQVEKEVKDVEVQELVETAEAETLETETSAVATEKKKAGRPATKK